MFSNLKLFLEKFQVNLPKFVLFNCSLKPSTQKVLALASEVKILLQEKDHLMNNLTTAEEEVCVCVCVCLCMCVCVCLTFFD